MSEKPGRGKGVSKLLARKHSIVIDGVTLDLRQPSMKECLSLREGVLKCTVKLKRMEDIKDDPEARLQQGMALNKMNFDSLVTALCLCVEELEGDRETAAELLMATGAENGKLARKCFQLCGVAPHPMDYANAEEQEAEDTLEAPF